VPPPPEAAPRRSTRSRMTVREVAARVGFEDVPYFHRAFAAQFGVTPLSLGRGLSEPPPPPSVAGAPEPG
ncbi:MAG: AraC family transcriptional regulator, partial [Planctomycetota bacterium]|nr:AraC family transcriptional regulator [Planctomycetota bacterium]